MAIICVRQEISCSPAEEFSNSEPEQVRCFVERLGETRVPVANPQGELACHPDAMRFLPLVDVQVDSGHVKLSR